MGSKEERRKHNDYPHNFLEAVRKVFYFVIKKNIQVLRVIRLLFFLERG